MRSARATRVIAAGLVAATVVAAVGIACTGLIHRSPAAARLGGEIRSQLHHSFAPALVDAGTLDPGRGAATWALPAALLAMLAGVFAARVRLPGLVLGYAPVDPLHGRLRL